MFLAVFVWTLRDVVGLGFLALMLVLFLIVKICKWLGP